MGFLAGCAIFGSLTFIVSMIVSLVLWFMQMNERTIEGIQLPSNAAPGRTGGVFRQRELEMALELRYFPEKYFTEKGLRLIKTRRKVHLIALVGLVLGVTGVGSLMFVFAA